MLFGYVSDYVVLCGEMIYGFEGVYGDFGRFLVL